MVVTSPRQNELRDTEHNGTHEHKYYRSAILAAVVTGYTDESGQVSYDIVRKLVKVGGCWAILMISG